MYQQTTGARRIQGRFGLSFFGRTYNNVGALGECKNNGQCVINKKNRTSCKSCRLKKCILVGMSKSGSRYGRRSNWFKIHCLIQDQVESNGRMSSDNQTLLTLANNDGNNPNLMSNNNNIGSATCTPSPSGHNSNNSSQNNGTISSSNNGSDLLAQYKSSLKETELNSSLNSNKLFNNKISSGQLPYNTLLQEVAKNSFKLNAGTNNKLNGSSNSNGSYPEETDTPPLQTKLNNKFNKNLSHLPLSPVSPLSPFFQNSIFARNLAQAAAAVNSNSTQNNNLSTNNLAAQNSTGLLGANQNNSNLISSNQNILNNPLYQNNFYQNYQAAAAAAAAAAHLLPLQPLLQNNTNNNNLTNSTTNLLNSLTNRNATTTPQQLLQQQLLQQQLEIAGLNNKLFGEKFKKSNENQAFGSTIDQDCPIDLSVKNSPLDTNALTQLCANYNLINELNGNLEGADQQTFSPSSSNEENFGLTGHLPIDLNNAQTLAAVASLKQTGNLFNNLNLAGLGNLNDLTSLNNLLNMNNNETKEANLDSYKNVLENGLEENSDDNEDESKLSKLQKTLNALTSAKNLIAFAQLNPNLLNLNNNNTDINSLLNFANNSHLNTLKLQQASAVNKLSQSLDIIRKLDNNLNVQNQSLNRLTSITSNLSNERKKINSNDFKKQKLVQNKEATKDKNNNEDLIKENKTKNQELDYDQNEDMKEEKSSDDEKIKKEELNKNDEEDEKLRLNKKLKKDKLNEDDEFEEENEFNKDENSQKSLLSQKNLNENRRKRRKRPSFENTKISENDIYSDSEQEQAKEINKKVKKEHQTDSETESIQE